MKERNRGIFTPEMTGASVLRLHLRQRGLQELQVFGESYLFKDINTCKESMNSMHNVISFPGLKFLELRFHPSRFRQKMQYPLITDKEKLEKF